MCRSRFIPIFHIHQKKTQRIFLISWCFFSPCCWPSAPRGSLKPHKQCNFLLSQQRMCPLSSGYMIGSEHGAPAPVWQPCGAAEAADSWAGRVCAAGVSSAWSVRRAAPVRTCEDRSRPMSDGGQHDHLCGPFEAQRTDGLLMKTRADHLHPSPLDRSTRLFVSECCRILHQPSVFNIRLLFSSLCICID